MKTYASNIFARVLSNALGVAKDGTPATDDQGHKGVWVTMQGRAIFIRDGETAEAALGRATGERPEDARNVRAIESRRAALLARQPKGKSEHERLQAQVDQARAARERRDAGVKDLEQRRKQEADDAKKKKEQAQEQIRNVAKPKAPAVSVNDFTRGQIRIKVEREREALVRDGFKPVGTRTDEKLGGEKDGVREIVEEHSISDWEHPDGRKASIHEIADKKTWAHTGAMDDAPMRLEVQRSSK